MILDILEIDIILETDIILATKLLLPKHAFRFYMCNTDMLFLQS